MESDPQGLKEKSKAFVFQHWNQKGASLKLYNGIVLDMYWKSVFWKVLPLSAFLFQYFNGADDVIGQFWSRGFLIFPIVKNQSNSVYNIPVRLVLQNLSIFWEDFISFCFGEREGTGQTLLNFSNVLRNWSVTRTILVI